ncbi:mCG51554 [Mus musculus]|nr:mCG51554 [Mus musculus]
MTVIVVAASSVEPKQCRRKSQGSSPTFCSSPCARVHLCVAEAENFRITSPSFLAVMANASHSTEGDIPLWLSSTTGQLCCSWSLAIA